METTQTPVQNPFSIRLPEDLQHIRTTADETKNFISTVIFNRLRAMDLCDQIITEAVIKKLPAIPFIKSLKVWADVNGIALDLNSWESIKEVYIKYSIQIKPQL